MITATEYAAIIAAGIKPTRHAGDFSGLTGFAAACYSENTATELLEALAADPADCAIDCEQWELSPDGWRIAIEECLEAMAYDYAS